jgi:hypothetical protein
MLVFVPQGFVALVYEDGALSAVLEAGVGVVARAEKLQLQFVDLQTQAGTSDQETEVLVTLQ